MSHGLDGSTSILTALLIQHTLRNLLAFLLLNRHVGVTKNLATLRQQTFSLTTRVLDRVVRSHALVRCLVAKLICLRTLQAVVRRRIVLWRAAELLELVARCRRPNHQLASLLLHDLLTLVLVLLNEFIVGLIVVRLELLVDILVWLFLFVLVAAALAVLHLIVVLLLGHLHGHGVLLEKWPHSSGLLRHVVS